MTEDMEMLSKQIREVASCMSAIKVDVAVVKADVIAIKERFAQLAEHCPQRERIRSTEDRIDYLRAELMEARTLVERSLELAQANRVTLAERSVAGVIGGGVVAVIVAVVQIVPHLLK